MLRFAWKLYVCIYLVCLLNFVHTSDTCFSQLHMSVWNCWGDIFTTQDTSLTQLTVSEQCWFGDRKGNPDCKNACQLNGNFDRMICSGFWRHTLYVWLGVSQIPRTFTSPWQTLRNCWTDVFLVTRPITSSGHCSFGARKESQPEGVHVDWMLVQAGRSLPDFEGVLGAQHDWRLLSGAGSNCRRAPDAYASWAGVLVPCLHLWQVSAGLLQCWAG